MNTIIKQIEKGKPFFETISRNKYLTGIRDGFLSAMPAILFSSIFILIAAVPEIFGYQWSNSVTNWLWKVYGYSMGMVALLVAATTSRSLADAMNRDMPKNRIINTTSVMLAAIVSFLLLSVSQVDGGISTEYMGTKGLLSAFVAAFVTVNVYKFCVLNDVTIKMPKEVPGTISQTFRDIFPFSFAILAAVIIDIFARNLFGYTFAEVLIIVLQPLFSAADGYLGIAIIWGAMALFWFVGVHGPSIVEPAIAAIIYANVDINLQLYNAGGQASNVLTTGLGNFVGTMGGTGATFVVPFIFLLFAKSKQLKAVGKVSVVPVCFAVNEPLLFATPIVLNPYFFVPFLLAPIVNVWIFKWFVDILSMNSFIYILPWATPAPIGLVLGTGMGLLAFVLAGILIVVDALIYFPFVKAYDAVLLEQERENKEVEEVSNTDSHMEKTDITIKRGINVLVLCAGAGTSAMLANALTDGAKDAKVDISATAGAYGSHYEIMQDYDIIVLAPQVNSYYEDIKKDTDRLGISLVATKGAEYIKLTRDSKKAVDFILDALH